MAAMLSWKYKRIPGENRSDRNTLSINISDVNNDDDALEIDLEIGEEKLDETTSRGIFYLLNLSMSFGA